MSKVEMLRAFVNQRLTAAAEEIFEQFERTIAEYEEELESRSKENHRQQKLLDAVINPEVRLHRAVSPDVQQLLVVKEEVPSEQQEWSSSLDQEDPEPPHIKEEQEELWISQEGEELQGLEEAGNKFLFTSVPVKIEEEDEEKAQSSQLHEIQTEENREAERTEADGEDCGGPEPDSSLQPEYFSEPETDDSGDWEEKKEPPSGLNLLQNNEQPVSDMGFNTGEPSVISSACAGSFEHMVQLQKHTGVQTVEKPFSCTVCGKRYPLKQSLTAHMKLHTEASRFTCSICETSFGTSSNLINHIRIHTGEKPFSCSFCDKSFSQKGHLRRHLTVHTGEKPFSCSICSKKFTEKDHLRRHLTVHTGEKPFSCSICSKTFAEPSNLRQHLTVHTGEKPFSCSFCDKTFALKLTLKRHLTIHTGEKPFSCSVCDKRFTQLHSVKNHKCVGESSSCRDAC